jgi:septal ring factor EnvC (AmiA/AmiB activator)
LTNDAKWLAEEVLLPRLNALDKKLEKRDEVIWSAINKNRKDTSETEKKLVSLDGDVRVIDNDIKHMKNNCKVLSKHLDDPVIHFDKEKARETNLGYWARKKVLIILITALSILVSSSVGIAVAWMNRFGG